jgi:hypothetical protein
VTSRADVDSSFILSVAIGQLRASELLLRHSPISSTVAPLRGDTKGKMGVASAGVTLRSTISTSTALAYRRDAVDRHNWEAARNAITTGVGRRVPDGNIGHSAWAALQRGPFPIAGDYPDDYRAVLRIPRHSLDHLRSARIPGTMRWCGTTRPRPRSLRRGSRCRRTAGVQTSTSAPRAGTSSVLGTEVSLPAAMPRRCTWRFGSSADLPLGAVERLT